jgi:hypothetical protein
MTSLRPTPLRPRLGTVMRVIAGSGIFAAGILAASAFASSAPAAPQDCLPVVGCVTTIVPTVSLPGVTTLPVLPTLPTLPDTTTTATPGVSTAGSTTTTTITTTSNSTTTSSGDTTLSDGALAFRPKASVRVRGRGARRVVEIRVNLTKAARLNALLSRTGPIARRLFTAKAGPHLFRLRIGRAARPGLANLSLVYRAVTGEAVRTTHRLRLPR